MNLVHWIRNLGGHYVRRGAALALIGLALIAGAGGAGAGVMTAAEAQTSVRLPGHVLPALAQASRVATTSRAANAESQPVTLTVILNRTDEAGFQKYLADVENPRSPNHLRFLSQAQVTQRFGPSQKAYDAVLTWLQQQGFTLSEGSTNHLTLTVKGTRAQAEQAFQVNIGDYTLKSHSFYANDQDPAVPASLARGIQSIIGLTDLAQPQRPAPNTESVSSPEEKCLLDLLPGGKAETASTVLEALELPSGPIGILAVADSVGACVAAIELDRLICLSVTYDDPTAECKVGGDPPPTSTGAGQKVGLVEFDTFHPSDVSDWLQFVTSNVPSNVSATEAGQVSEVNVNGGVAAPGPGEAEVLLDIDTILGVATGANVAVYDAPGSTSFQAVFNAMLTDPAGPPTVISNSWSECEDQMTLADVQSLDSILANAAASGISVLNGSGDTGSTCLDGSPNTVGVPADSPNATAVGGTSVIPATAFTYRSESWWDGSQSTPQTGQGGFGTSRFFSRPSYQNGPVGSTMRSVPDVAANADPVDGFQICEADTGGCPDGLFHAGTSLAAPEWAAFAALLNQAQGHNLGLLNPLLYPLAATNGFHSAASMGSDFAHVGLGSPNFDALSLALKGATVGPVSPTVSTLVALPRVSPADGTTQATLLVQLSDADANPVSGKNITIAANSGSHAVISTASGPSNSDNGAVTFSVTDNSVEAVTFTATDTTDNLPLQQTVTVNFVSPPATAGGISANPTSVPADGTMASTITVTLQDAAGGVSGKTVNLSQGGGHSTITGPTPPVTDQNGQLTFSVTDSQTESVTYTATDVTDGDLPVPGSATVSFTNGTANSCSHGTPTAAAGWAFTDFATGFPLDPNNFGCLGPIGLTFDASGNLYAMDTALSTLYEFGTAGGEADGATELAQIPSQNGNQTVGNAAGIAFGKDGRLYAAQEGGFEGGGGQVIELDPATGQVLRVVAPYAGFGSTDCAAGIATDPLSGDLFITEPHCTLLGFEPYINRIANPASSTPTLSHYATPGVSDGITFTPDGTIYVAQGNNIDEISGTNKPQPPTITTVFTFQNTQTDTPGPDGVAVAPNPQNPSGPPLLFVNRNDGTITELDLSQNPPAQTDIFTGGSRGDFVAVGPDGCLYATQTDRIIKVTKADGSCPFAPTSALPQIGLAPSVVSPNPATGSAVTLTAALHNISNPQGTPITFSVSGANPQTQQVAADASGKATFTYMGAHTGADGVLATATSGSGASAITVTSSPASVTWVAGKDVTFLDLNTSPTSDAQNVPVTLVAHLSDASQTPPAPLAGQPITLAIGSGGGAVSCTATTDSTAAATCSVTPTMAAGLYPLTATYTGSSQYTAATATASFSVTSLMPTSLAYTGATTVNMSGQAALAAKLTARVGGPLAGKSVGFTLGSGASAQTCSGTTDSTGTANCSITVSGQPVGSVPLTASFAGDGTDAASFAGSSFTACGKGDVNCNSVVDATDALCILRFVANLPSTPACPIPLPNPAKIATDGNTNLDATDALCILRHVANLPATNACPAWGSQPAGVSREAPGVRRAGEPSAAFSLSPSSVRGTAKPQTTVQLVFDASRLPAHDSRALGSWTIDITYDAKAVKVVSCEPAGGGICNAAYAPGVARIVGASASGLAASQPLATLTFEGLGSAAKSPLTVTAVSLTDPEGGNVTP